MSSDEAKVVRAAYAFKGKNNDELQFKKGDLITITRVEDGGWWEGTLNGKTGWFPSNYVKEVKDPTLQPSNAKIDSCNRDLVIRHLAESERTYVDELNRLVANYLNVIESADFLTTNDYQNLCNNLTDILDFQKEILAEIERCERLSQANEKRPAGVLMLRAPQLKSLYETYSVRHPISIRIIETHDALIDRCLQSSAGQNSSLKSTSSESRRLSDLTKLLSLPFKRLELYPNILIEMERYTELSHPDRGDTQRAITVYKDIEVLCSERRKQTELAHEVLTSQILGWEGKPINQLGELLKLSEAMVAHPAPSFPLSSPAAEIDNLLEERLLLLFPAVFVLLSSSPTSTSFALQAKIYLSGSTVTKLEDTDAVTAGFILTGTMMDPFLFICRRKADQREWIDLLHKQSSAPVANALPIRPTIPSSSSSSLPIALADNNAVSGSPMVNGILTSTPQIQGKGQSVSSGASVNSLNTPTTFSNSLNAAFPSKPIPSIKTGHRSCLRPIPPLRPVASSQTDPQYLAGSSGTTQRREKKGSVLRKKPAQTPRLSRSRFYLTRLFKSIEDDIDDTGNTSEGTTAYGRRASSEISRILHGKENPTPDDDAQLLSVIDAYCTTAKTRHTVNSVDLRQRQNGRSLTLANGKSKSISVERETSPNRTKDSTESSLSPGIGAVVYRPHSGRQHIRKRIH